MFLTGATLKKAFISLFALSFVLFVTLKYQKIEDRGSLRWFERPIVFATAPLGKGIFFIRDHVRSVWTNYFYLVGARKENETLKQRLQEIQSQLIFFDELKRENDNLHKLLKMKSELSAEWMVARVVSYPPMNVYRVLTIDKGSDDGMERRSPVVGSEGLVGQIVRVFPHYSEVLLITDPTSAVDARIQNTGARGLIVGRVVKLAMQREFFLTAFEYLNQAALIQEGAAVVTSGLDGIFPAGIRLGTVGKGHKTKYDIFQQAEVVPSVDFHQLREVLVLRKP